MEYQHIQANQIKNLDYWSLLNILMNPISSETRATILEKLTEMNNQLLVGNSLHVQPDLARPSMLNSKRKSSSEASYATRYEMQNPLPLDMPVNTNNQFMQWKPPSESTNSWNAPQMFPQNWVNPANPANPYNSTNSNQKFYPEIDLDDIINDLNDDSDGDSDNLDKKLAKIKLLNDKIITDKRRRRKEREQRKLSV
jgi:hypothetical protein